MDPFFVLMTIMKIYKTYLNIQTLDFLVDSLDFRNLFMDEKISSETRFPTQFN